MTRLLRKNNLLLALAFLLGTRLVVVPILGWQQEGLAAIEGKYLYRAKMENLMGAKGFLLEDDLNLTGKLNLVHESLFVDDNNLKLNVQTKLEGFFAKNGLSLKKFTWMVDNSVSIRTLKAKVFFSGSVDNVIQTLWDVSTMPELIGIVESSQRMKKFPDEIFSLSEGFVVFEIHAVTPLSDPESTNIGGGS